ncbi:MAG: hypothetical protein NUV57_02945 [archaeon]|nr:hypothetical protein [archaeon]
MIGPRNRKKHNIFPSNKSNRPPEKFLEQFTELENHPIISRPLIELVSVSMNLSMNVRGYPVDQRHKVVLDSVTSGILFSQLTKVNSLIRAVNNKNQGEKQLKEITPEELFSLIVSRV